jgi:hypothetical protein
MIAPGKYMARAVEAELGYTSGDKAQVAVCFELIDGDYAGQQINWYGYFTDKTMPTTLKALRACGWEGDDLSNLDGIDVNEVELVISHEDDLEGNARARVRWVNRPGDGGVQLKKRMDEQQRKAFAAQMKGRVVAEQQRGGNGSSGGGGQQRRQTDRRYDDNNLPPEAHGDDDIPF